MQEERIRSWCKVHDYETDSVFIEVMSGGKAGNRPELQKAVALTCKLKGILVVYSLSRLARSVKDTLEIAERLERAGGNLASLSERIDTNSAMGKMVFRLLSTLNEFERDQLAERTSSAMAHLRRANRRISGRIPLGYDLAHDGLSLVPNRKEQKIVGRIDEWRKNGLTMVAIAEKLTAARIPTKTGTTIWCPSTIRGILERQKHLV